MTNDLEKQFFDTFGIEAKYESHSCDGWGRTVEVKYFTDKKEADKFGIIVSELEYPQITDHILLELICILNSVSVEFKSECIEDLKREILGEITILLEYAPNEETAEFIKHQVRTLFEEG